MSARQKDSRARRIVDVSRWLKELKYLPPVMRDFHDQKDLFKAMHEAYEDRVGGNIKMPTWVEGQVYVIDWFLWFMARRGYTLQRTRTKGDFRDLVTDVQAATEKRDQAYVAAFSSALPVPSEDRET